MDYFSRKSLSKYLINTIDFNKHDADIFINYGTWQGLQVLFHIVMAKFPIPENCSAYDPMILQEFCSSKINGLVMKTFSWDGGDIRFCGQK
jgi:hypothetical protein